MSKVYNRQIALPKSEESQGYVDPKELEYSQGYTSYEQLDAPKKVRDLIQSFNENPIRAVRTLFGIWPTKQQTELIQAAWGDDSRVAVSSCTGAGKALVNYEKVHTPEGLVRMGDIQVGQKVSNSYGATSTVTAVYPQGSRHCYKVNFNNGTSVDCDLEHRWNVATYHKGSNFNTMTLEEILDKGIYVEAKVTSRGPTGRRLKYYLPKVDALEKDKKEVPVDPYTMGVWLGDGTKGTGRITNIDQEVWDNIDYKVSTGDSQTKTAHGLITDLKKTTVWEEGSHTKFIPEEYLDNDKETRRAVLSGLMDTDGTIDKKGRLTYYTTSSLLRDGFIKLVRGLGGTTKGYSTKKTTHSDCYCIQFQYNVSERLFRIERKESRRSTKVHSSRVYIESVEYIGEQEATCITVDSKDSLFICENYIPTHNTAALTWLTFLFLLCKYDCRILITSPSFQQLNRVFNSEANKWKAKMDPIWSDMFTITRERIVLNTKKGVQIANIVTASAENEESLQGGHADNYVILADEASAINEGVFDILQGTLSTGVGRFILTSNPTRSSGRFFEIFHRMKEAGNSKWNPIFFSALDCPHVNDHFIEEIAEMYGEDSDQYRVRILGQFPRTSLSQFIGSNLVDDAMVRQIDIREVQSLPKICGVDVARHGDDKTVFVTRQGPKVIDVKMYSNLDGPEVATKLLDYYRDHGHKRIYIDAHGVGASPYDAAKNLPGIKGIITPLNVSIPSSRPTEFANVRAHLWGEMKNWLQGEVDLPYMPELRAHIVSQTYGFNGKLAYLLTAKKDMKSQGIDSPDTADALSFTFADNTLEVRRVNVRARNVVKSKRRRAIGF